MCIMEGTQFTPTAKKGSGKYGRNGKCSAMLFSNFKLSEATVKVLSEVGDYGLAKSTWSTYSTAERMLALCGKQRKREMRMPLSEDDLLEFVGWLTGERNLKAGTINSYLSGIRQLHILKGMEPPLLRTNLMKFLLKAKKNMDELTARQKSGGKRLPITISVMKLLKEKIRRWEVPLMQKLLMWSISTVAFHGAFRIHELLCRTESEFDPDFVLLSDNVKINSGKEGLRVLEITLQCPKESRNGQPVVLEVYETKGALCPVKAFERWFSRTLAVQGMPLFRDERGVPVTGTKMNRWLKDRLKDHVDYDRGKFTSHSFRSGLATSLGTIGCSDSEIKEAGRWSSRAYELYMKLPRVKRAGVARTIGRLEQVDK